MASRSPHQPRPREAGRTLHLHAGPHKTATTYLQSRLKANRSRLEAQGLRYPIPFGEHSHRHLARALKAGAFHPLEHLLERQARWSGDLLLSAEHFIPLVSDAEALATLHALCDRHGFALHVICFVRPQAGLLNSFYAHGLGRLYGTPTFSAYVRAQLAGRRLKGEAQRRWIRMGPLELDFERRFAPLLAEDAPAASFLPFRPRLQDPFAQLQDLLGLSAGPWRDAPADQANEQLGRRGLGLAFLLNRQLDALPVRRQVLIARHGLNRLVERLRVQARRRGWVEERFNGWNGALIEELSQALAASNAGFAQRVWGQSWEQIFPDAFALETGAGDLVLEEPLHQEADALFVAYRRGLPAALR